MPSELQILKLIITKADGSWTLQQAGLYTELTPAHGQQLDTATSAGRCVPYTRPHSNLKKKPDLKQVANSIQAQTISCCKHSQMQIPVLILAPMCSSRPPYQAPIHTALHPA
jgi:hypothetical protein